VINYYDLVPHAWQTLKSIPANWKTDPFYPGADDHVTGPGPTAKPGDSIGVMIDNIADSTYDNNYVQPKQQPALNPPLGLARPLFLWDYPPGAQTDLQKFELQVGFQHDNNTYLTLLGAPGIAAAGVGRGVDQPHRRAGSGRHADHDQAPSGVVFSPDSVVDFGITPASSQTVAPGGQSIAAISPPGVGTVDVRVTNMFGTSPAVPTVPNLTFNHYSNQFTYNAP
jgi:hypothetical protein